MSPLARPVVAVLHDGTDVLPPSTELDQLADVRPAVAAELADVLPGADVLLAWDFSSGAVERAWHAVDSLRWVHTASAGVDRLLFPALLQDSDIVLTNSRGVFDQPIAEYVLGLVLAFAKDLPTTVDLQREHRWQHRETERIAGRRALVIGTGPIGRATGRLLRAAGLLVEGVGRRAREDDPDLGRVHASEDLLTALPDADFIVCAAPLTPATRGMIDAAALAAMRPDARFINVGRGALVVEDDLIAALGTGGLAGAALDVVASEPLSSDSPLWTMPGVVISPHMSGDVKGWRSELLALFLANLRRYRDGEALDNVVDKARGYVTTG
ncbi:MULTISPECIES: D-2-hydroxyacid dehydrogenase [Actinoalloteichus]|uniref:Phosphoglycerate dehydrogenase-like oxidoreductase n=1 Tax=Actinoalloteichus fjordicus TaxID=1612552 RepID=A0AAC9LAU7_9PSEU|nr:MULTISPECIES: D-2-hydroxyacid dehydrogenase [Actinoalloteichus]APU14383.1 phosphoglycerate dehydrogenase-like oxidoreductase [Actinoalloteichus fjordicus]APU20352.1 phosphoglycerate dehydrogenase-like oxidoreductase [Actinoalloteichus sp. GBA129-24]